MPSHTSCVGFVSPWQSLVQSPLTHVCVPCLHGNVGFPHGRVTCSSTLPSQSLSFPSHCSTPEETHAFEPAVGPPEPAAPLVPEAPALGACVPAFGGEMGVPPCVPACGPAPAALV